MSFFPCHTIALSVKDAVVYENFDLAVEWK